MGTTQTIPPQVDATSAIEAFLMFIEFELGLSANTLIAYRTDLRAFAAFCETLQTALTQATPEIVGRYLQHLQAQRHLEISSMMRNVATLKSFFKFAVGRGLAPVNPLELLDRPHHWKKLPDVLGRDQIQALLKAVDPLHRLALRDQAIVELFYACGLRASELADLLLSDLHFDLGVIRVIGKGAKERIVPIGGPAAQALQDYLSHLRPALLAVPTQRAKSTTRVFLSRSGGPVTRIVLWQLVQKLARQAGLRRIHPHTLRHTFATHLLSGGADLRVVQELLGHADVGTTQNYTHVDADRLKAVHKKHHPRA